MKPSQHDAPIETAQAQPGGSQSSQFQPLGQSQLEPVELAEECALAIAYNGLSQAVMMVSPIDLEDFVVGFSLGSGIVESVQDIYDIRIGGTGSGRHAEVEIANRAFWKLKQQRRQLPGNASCGLCGVEALEQALPQLPVMPVAALPPAHWLQDLRQRIETAITGKACRLVRIASEYAGRRGETDSEVLVGLDQINPQELFARAWEEQFGNPPDEQTLDDFATLLLQVEFASEEVDQ